MFNDPAHFRPVILVVVHDPADRASIRIGLESADYRIEEAVDGLSALEIFRTVHPQGPSRCCYVWDEWGQDLRGFATIA